MTNWRAFLLRRLLGRLRIGNDVVRHLTSFQRLGERLEVQPPGEMLPVGARTVFRAIRTRGATQIEPDWLWPFWLERQIDPLSPSFVPRGHLPFLSNVTHRNWTMVGNVVAPWCDGPSLDWWIGADDRWHLPSRDVAVRQGLHEGMPIVETTMRIPSGD